MGFSLNVPVAVDMDVMGFVLIVLDAEIVSYT